MNQAIETSKKQTSNGKHAASTAPAPLLEATYSPVMAYVCGFCFNHSRTQVALIRKNHPEWQAGRLNGIGGRIERGESPAQAMAREFKEETGYTDHLHWEKCLVLSGPEAYLTDFEKKEKTGTAKNNKFIVYFFRCFSDNFFNYCQSFRYKSPTDERIEIVQATYLYSASLQEHSYAWFNPDLIHNLTWLLPLLGGRKGNPIDQEERLITTKPNYFV